MHNCDDIRVIESCFLAILIVSGFAAIFTLAGSIIGCMGTCCARTQVIMPGEVLPSDRLMGMYLWMGSYLLEWIDYNEAAF